jgi:hypothetical protein
MSRNILKRSRDDDFGSERETARPRVEASSMRSVVIEPLPSTHDIKEQLARIASDIIKVSDLEGESDSTIKEIKDQFEILFRDVINDATTKLLTAKAERDAIAMETAQLQIKNEFLSKLEPITKRISEELTVSEQARMFTVIVRLIEERLNDNQIIKDLEQDPTQGGKIIEAASKLAAISFNYIMIHLSITLSNIYNASPAVIKKATSTITATYLMYNYAPSGLRGALEVLPVLGPIFKLMNKINPEALIFQNSVASVTGIYYLLRNAGVDLTPAVQSVGELARGATTICAFKAGNFVCDKTTQGLEMMKKGTKKLADVLSDHLVSLLVPFIYPVSHNLFPRESYISSQQSVDSVSSKTITSATTQNSVVSRQIIEDVEVLLGTPVHEGGINISVIDSPPEIIEERIEAIISGDVSNQIIAAPIKESITSENISDTGTAFSSPANSQSFGISTPSRVTSPRITSPRITSSRQTPNSSQMSELSDDYNYDFDSDLYGDINIQPSEPSETWLFGSQSPTYNASSSQLSDYSETPLTPSGGKKYKYSRKSRRLNSKKTHKNKRAKRRATARRRKRHNKSRKI